LLTNSVFSAETIRRVYSFKPHVLYPPVDLRKFCASEKEDLVVSVGRFDPSKKHEILIRAFKHVKNNARCIIIGSSAGDILSGSRTYLSALEKLVRNLGLSDRVTFLVNCPSGLLSETLSKAKVYVHCYYGEHFGISVVEAMASGCVPIVNKSGGAYYDILRSGLYGFGFENEDDLAESLNLLLDNEDTWITYSEKAIVRSKCFNKENFKRRIADIVEMREPYQYACMS
jgi:glycosyltransferase involved in cell wall biosynthesis